MFGKEPLHEVNIFVERRPRAEKKIASVEREGEGDPIRTLEAEGYQSIGRQLLTKLLHTAKELQGRVVGRNNDDACILLNGLEILSREWNTMEQDLQLSNRRSQDENAAPRNGFPSASQHQSPAQQSRTYVEAVAQARRLEEELDEIKTKWEHALSSTVDQQIAIQRQRLRDRESVIAQQEAELSQLRLSQEVRSLEISRPSRAGSSRSSSRYIISGRVEVGQTLQVDALDGSPVEDVAYQWYRVVQDEEWLAISGAARQQYSPEPYDCGCPIGCYVLPIDSTDPKQGFKAVSEEAVGISKSFLEWVNRMYNEGKASFGVVVVQRNGLLHTNREICELEINRQNVTIKLRDNGSILQSYSSGMQVCGARGAGSAAAQGVFLALRGQEVYMLACKTAKERNACILLIRKMAALHGLDLRGPE